MNHTSILDDTVAVPNNVGHLDDCARKPTASVIIPAHNAEWLVRDCLENLASSRGCDYEVIVVDDGSSDKTAEVAAEMGARVVRLDQKMGPAAARNRGAAVATGEILVFIDSDVFVVPDTIAKLVGLLQRESEYDAVIGSYDATPTAQNLVSQYKNLLHHYTHQIASSEAFTFWTGCGAVRRNRFTELGGFDESFAQPSIEDIEFGNRLKKSGSRICLESEIQVKHAKCWRLSSLIKTDFFCRALPWTRLILKQKSMPNDLNLKSSQRLCVLSVALLSVWMLFALRWEPWVMPLLAVSVLLVLLIDRIEETRWNRSGSRLAAFFLLGGFLSIGTFAPISSIAITMTLLFVMILNRDLFRFFADQRGWVFAIISVPLHVTYYLYSGLGFLLGCFKHLWFSVFGESTVPCNSELIGVAVMNGTIWQHNDDSAIASGSDARFQAEDVNP